MTERKLGGDMSFLGELLLVEICNAVGEIAAGVLAVTIDKEIVDGAIDLVLVRHVAARRNDGVEPHDSAYEEARSVETSGPIWRRPLLGGPGQEDEQIVDLGARHPELAGHVALAKGEMQLRPVSKAKVMTGSSARS